MILVEATVLEDGKLAARCCFCGQVEVWSADGRKPVGGILYVRSQCNVRKAFDRDGIRRSLALRVPR